MTKPEQAFLVHRALLVLYGLLTLLTGLSVAVGPAVPAWLSPLPFVLFFGLMACVHWWTGRACRTGSNLGRSLSVALAVIMLLGFPFGTLIGLYLLSVTLKAWTTPDSVRS
ncbi:hypothetical protein [Inhella sp.]|uniref:hypothetical protein n=1 Tax=Inhella sp. TaxID=1921806 RepID=UPI0035ADBC0F